MTSGDERIETEQNDDQAEDPGAERSDTERARAEVGLDEGAAGAGDEDAHSEAEDEWARIEEELSETRDRHLRLAAEFENYRKRTREELLQSGTRAQAALIGSLLDVLDDFDRIVSMDPEQVTAESVLEGAGLVERKLKRVLEETGVERIDPEGEVFDPERMEAVMREPAETEDDDDRVSRVFQKGVVFKGHLVRPARVAVRKSEE